jgi:hypothetical protein
VGYVVAPEPTSTERCSLKLQLTGLDLKLVYGYPIFRVLSSLITTVHRLRIIKVLTDSFVLVELDLVDFFPKRTVLIHLAGDFPILALSQSLKRAVILEPVKQ